MIALLRLAWRGFFRNLRRYRVLLGGLVLAVGLLLLLVGVALGMREALRDRARRFFGGDLTVVRLGPRPTLVPARTEGSAHPADTARDPWTAAADQVIADLMAREAGLVAAAAPRALYTDTGSIQLFHAGNYVRQRRVIGVDWEREAPVLRALEFVAGGLPGTRHAQALGGTPASARVDGATRTAVLIEATAAEALEARPGDALTLSIRTDRGRTNTISLQVAGIFREPNYLGLGLYMDRRTLNELREAHPDRADHFSVFLHRGEVDTARGAAAIEVALQRADLETAGVLWDRPSYRDARDRWSAAGTGATAVVALRAQLDEVEEIVQALSVMALAIVALFGAIVSVGVGNTYRLIVYERTREIGALRAMGMQRHRVTALFLWEALILGAVGVAAGTLVGFGLLHAAVAMVRLEDQELASLFLVQSRLHWRLPWPALLGAAALGVAAAVVGSLRAALRAGRTTPVEALRHE